MNNQYIYINKNKTPLEVKIIASEVEYYDSRYVVKDDVTGKFYKWNVKVSNGTPTIEVVEV